MIYNLKCLEYEDFYHFEFYDKPCIRSEKEDDNTITDVIEKSKIKIIEDLQRDLNKDHTLKVSMNRSKNNLYRIARSNRWDLFITVTFDRKKVDASDYEQVAKKITVWLNNLRKRGNPDLKYLIVPEFHSDGINYHFHGLLANCDSLVLVDSGHKDFTGSVIYNISNWKIGFSTATKIKDNARVVNYIGKYITKDLLNRVKYKKRYFASRNCYVADEILLNIQPDKVLDLLVQDPEYIKTLTIPEANQRIKYFEIKKELTESGSQNIIEFVKDIFCEKLNVKE